MSNDDKANVCILPAIDAAIASTRATLASLETIRAALATDSADQLVSLRDGWPLTVDADGKTTLAPSGISGETLCRWARSGRLQAFEVERGRLVAWSSAIKRAIESQPYTPNVRAVPAAANAEFDPFTAAIESGELAIGGRR